MGGLNGPKPWRRPVGPQVCDEFEYPLHGAICTNIYPINDPVTLW